MNDFLFIAKHVAIRFGLVFSAIAALIVGGILLHISIERALLADSRRARFFWIFVLVSIVAGTITFISFAPDNH